MTHAFNANALLGSHARRLNRVIDHVDTHLAEDLRLDTLARMAAFSPFHFHRLFRAWTGETLKDFVRRRRLETAGNRLRFNPDVRISEVAQACGFASAETFARAFRQHFGVTPSAWRQSASHHPRLARYGIPGAGIRLGKTEVRRLPPREVLYWRAQGDYHDVADPMWTRFIPWIRTLGLGDQPTFGMGLDDPGITPAQHCRYDVCVALPEGWKEEPRLRPSRKQIAGGWYACLEFCDDRTKLGAAWAWFIEEWLPESGFIAGNGPFFEAYPARTPRGDTGIITLELCMPVVPLGR
jgi:AraC family transcriptional regulator